MYKQKILCKVHFNHLIFSPKCTSKSLQFLFSFDSTMDKRKDNLFHLMSYILLLSLENSISDGGEIHELLFPVLVTSPGTCSQCSQEGSQGRVKILKGLKQGQQQLLNVIVTIQDCSSVTMDCRHRISPSFLH